MGEMSLEFKRISYDIPNSISPEMTKENENPSHPNLEKKRNGLYMKKKPLMAVKS